MPLVLDSFAIIVLYLAQPGWEKVRKYLIDAVQDGYSHKMSATDYGEIYYTILRRGGEKALAEVLSMMEEMQIEVIVPEFQDFIDAARFKGLYGASYPDCFAAVLARKLNIPVLTCDPDFRRLEPLGVKVEWLPPNR
ncbi:MAG: PIN domain-containing protein [Candidatus Kapaibacterium sp.]